ncbi:DNA topoisomerase III [Salinisphaera orenii]|uniref:DNA topoisomerase III n=1 Tax=Salinisphaera orenii TaxID=856731 RepID=UPI00195510D4
MLTVLHVTGETMAGDTVYLCEKPSQARDIARILGATNKTKHYLFGGGITVTWCFGHLLEMASPDQYGEQYKRWSLETLPIIPDQWRLDVRPKVKAQYSAIERLLGQAGHVVVATDADREGEMIAREILDRCGFRGRVSRLWLSALDDASIRTALRQLKDGAETEALYHAGLGRARADWLVGMNLTRAYTTMARSQGHDRLLPVGRVQTPTLRLVVDRDREIAAFRPVPYWDLVADLATDGGAAFTAQWQPPADIADAQGRCLNQPSAQTVAQQISGTTARVHATETKRERVSPPLPYDLGTLQQDASQAVDMGAQAVLDTVQSLYETHKAVTYPRTDCRYLPVSMFAEADAVLDAMTQTDPAIAHAVDQADAATQSKAWNDTKITAHHAIIPTAKSADLSRMSAAEQQLYQMIRTRYLVQFYPDHEADRTILSIDVAGAALRASGKTVIVEGWKTVAGSADETDEHKAGNARLPAVSEGDPCRVTDIKIQAKQTRPPAAYTEGTLIAAMKNIASRVTDERLKKIMKDTAGLGTEATRAGIIKTLIDRGFLAKKKKKRVSTEAGQALIGVLPQTITNPDTTALWEQALDDISTRRMTLEDFVARQTKWVRAAVGQVSRSGLAMPQGIEAKPQKKCPECGQAMRKRQSQHGAFWGCTGYPDCTTTVQIGGKRRRKKAAEE